MKIQPLCEECNKPLTGGEIRTRQFGVTIIHYSGYCQDCLLKQVKEGKLIEIK